MGSSWSPGCMELLRAQAAAGDAVGHRTLSQSSSDMTEPAHAEARPLAHAGGLFLALRPTKHRSTLHVTYFSADLSSSALRADDLVAVSAYTASRLPCANASYLSSRRRRAHRGPGSELRASPGPGDPPRGPARDPPFRGSPTGPAQWVWQTTWKAMLIRSSGTYYVH